MSGALNGIRQTVAQKNEAMIGIDALDSMVKIDRPITDRIR